MSIYLNKEHLYLFILAAAGLLLLAASSAAMGICLQTGPINGASDCQGQTLRFVKQQLNKTYGALKKTLGKTERKKLASAEDAWRKFRDRECTFETAITATPAQGSTSSGDRQNQCRLRLARRRLIELQRELNGTGDRDGMYPALSSRMWITSQAPGTNVALEDPSLLVTAGRPIYFYTTLAGLIPERSYRYECRILDADGTLVSRKQKRLTSGSGRYREVCAANPGGGGYAPGRWRFEVFIDGRSLIDAHRLVHFK
jgi:uncharacterized protein YecT (DUF1311 family)